MAFQAAPKIGCRCSLVKTTARDIGAAPCLGDEIGNRLRRACGDRVMLPRAEHPQGHSLSIYRGGGRRFPTLICACAILHMTVASAVYAQEPVAPPGWLHGLVPSAVAVASSHLPRDLSPWSMFLNADVIVRSVILGLALASLVTWTVWLAKSIELFRARRRLGLLLSTVSEQGSLAEASAYVGQRRGVLRDLMNAACTELRLSADIADGAGIKERIAIRLARLEHRAGRAMNKGTGLLATIGATAPFVGLFGTVWGIMNSFVGISKAQTTNLAIVAPGIAEALLATAVGLFAAIPAVIIYNQLSRSIGTYRALVGDASAAVFRLISRDLDRGLCRTTPRQATE
jgi:biopolymer transport protein ExbB